MWETTQEVRNVTLTNVQTGLNGEPGPSALCHVGVGHTPGSGSVCWTILVMLMISVREMTSRLRSVTLTHVQTGHHGLSGPSVPSLVVAALKRDPEIVWHSGMETLIVMVTVKR